MELPEFLLARFADDEEFALRYPPTAAARPRALAECEAKRRIVEDIAPVAEEVYEYDLFSVLRWLALPYAEHPDYREEWKP